MGIAYQLVPGATTVLEIRPLVAKLKLPLDGFIVRSLLRWSDLNSGSVYDVEVLKIDVLFPTVNLSVCFR